MKLTIMTLTAMLLLAGWGHSSALSSEQVTQEDISQLKLWIKVFRGDDIPSYGQSFSGRIELDGDDVLIFDKSATGPLTYAYPVPVQSSIIVITSAGALVIRCSPRTIPARFVPAIPSIKAALQKVENTPGLQRGVREDVGMWYSRILKVLVNFMER